MSNNGINFADFLIINRDGCKKKIDEIFRENKGKPIAIAINGKWGVGKSYFWKNEMTPFLKKELDITPIYTSVFGKRDENEIIKDLVSQFLTIENKDADSIRNFIEGTFKLFGKNTDMDLVFKFFKKEHMKNTIVCIDDFERLSDKIPVQDVLGLISELKENKECSVVVIYNEDELFKNDNFNQENNKNKSETTKEKIIFEKYKEKIFDFQIKFAPPPKEQFSLFMHDKLEKNFDAYKYFPDIINMDRLLQAHDFINLRELNRVNYTYQNLLKDFSLEKYPSEEFENIYNYILYPIAYAYHFELKPEYFNKNYAIGTRNLRSPHTSIYSNLLKWLLIRLREGFEIIQKTSFLYIPQLFLNPNGYTPIQECKNFLSNFVKKIINDTHFHMEYIKELDDQTSPEEVSIGFFLKHKNDIESIPYMFGYRILDYAFDNKDGFVEGNRTKSFALDLVIKKHEQEVLNLFNQWCNEAHDAIINNKNEQEYFWIDKFTFYYPLESLFKELNIPMPQNKLVEWFIKN